MSLTRILQIKYRRHIVLLSVIFLAVVIGLLLYKQSVYFKKQGDILITQGHPREAINFYQNAQRLFPFFSLQEDIEGATLILQSQNDYNSITGFAEIQSPPPISDALIKPLAANELFVPIFMYHHIEVNPQPQDPVYAALFVSPTQLNEQFSYLATHGFHTITLDQLLSALDGKTPLPSKPIILTFDDGYQSFYDNAYPLLKKYHMVGVQFVITQVLTNRAYLTWDEIVEMDKSGFVEIASHTRDHPNLPDLSQAAIVDEIKGSKKDLEEKLNHKVTWFAYPYGSYSPFIIQTVKDAGYFGATSTIYGTNQSKDNLFLFFRILVDGRFSIDNLAKRIQK